ncbi:MAG: 3-deoxy-manno-octulosonate cytidylyltransferase [Alphaproteobacteria bacterium]|nr:3-deoxy-manno-octulosonate cytidylyltransferase [Alphaproteobacteria bacterium]
MSTAIVIPARHGSTRFPGKPLAIIAGETMLSRVVRVAREVARNAVAVATEDERIARHCEEINVQCFMTPDSCRTGSDRVLAAIGQMMDKPSFVVNLQGDAPFTPPEAIRVLFEAFRNDPGLEVVTPVHRLSWSELDALREAKRTTPFSGTTAILAPDNRALWFSKSILPAIRKEKSMRESGAPCPVWRHLGLYGFRIDVLERFCSLPPGVYEELEGLEQLRLIENDIRVQAVPVAIDGGIVHSGIDSPEDIARAENALASRQPPA